MFCAPGNVSGCTECVGSRFHVLLSRTHFRRYRGNRVPSSSFALPDSFSEVPRASEPVFMFCAHGDVLSGTEGVESHFHILRSRSHFLRYLGRQVPFSCFTRLDSISTVPRASGHIFMFCASGLVFRGTDGVESRFHVLRSHPRFWRYRGCRVPFLFFYAPKDVSRGTEGIGSRFHVLRTRRHF
jgi:hypothetical protein